MDAFAETAERFNTISNPGGYLRTAVVNGARRRARLTDNRQRIREENVVSFRIANQEPVGEHYLDDVLATLSEREHSAIVLIYYARYTYAEAASLLGEPVGTVKSLVSRALGRLRTEVSA